MGYRQPTNAERSLKDRVSYAQEVINPLRLIPKKVATAIGDKIRFRILSLDPTDTRVLTCKRLNCISKKGTPYNIDLFEQLDKGDDANLEVVASNDLSKVVDSDGDPLKTAVYVRVPVFVRDAVNSKGTPLTTGKNGSEVFETDRLMYLELSSVMISSIYALEDDQEVEYTFSDKTGLPLFDIWLTRKAKSGENTWKVSGISKKFDKDGFGKDWEEALGDDVKNYVYDDSPGNAWGDVQTAMDEFMDEDEVKRNLKRGGTSEAAPTLNKDKGAEPENKVDDVDADIEDAEAGDPPAEERPKRSRFAGRAKD